MAVKLKFDSTHNVLEPTLVLCTRSGRKIGSIPAVNLSFKDCLNACEEMQFKVYKEDCKDKVGFWNKIVDFRLVWVADWDKFFEIYIEIEESNDIVKTVTAKSLGEAELSQINLYGIEINTEDDILREDYEPTVLYDKNHPNASLLTRISEKIPHYTIKHVDSSIAGIQRTFTFDDKSIYDSFQEIAEEIDCIFIIDCHSDKNGKIAREISVCDLEANCLECGERGEFSVCPKCGSTNIYFGYGEDTSIYVSTVNLADSITYTTDNGAVKNCFRLEAGDDLMTATLVNCNPNGTGYIWYISDMVKDDMSPELVKKLEQYDKDYAYYQSTYPADISGSELDAYNALVRKYKTYTDKYSEIQSPIVGYSALMEAYYNTIDFYLYLRDSLMPVTEKTKTTAELEVAKLTASNLSPVAVRDLNICSSATADSAVLGMARTIVNNRYQVKLSDTAFQGTTWTGFFTVTSYIDSEDTAKSGKITVRISDDYKGYVEQKINKALRQSITNDEITDIVQLFGLNDSAFREELKKYSLSALTSFRGSCQTCIDVLTEQGAGNDSTWQGTSTNLYQELYLPYYNKLGYIEQELSLRESECETIVGVYDSDNHLIADGLQTLLDVEREKIHDFLNFEDYLGHDLWLEFAAYRREDTYRNDNYISDGLDNAELFDNARKFIEIAQKEIFKSATLQHSITATLKDLLTMVEFQPIVDHFEVGNWIRIRVDDNIYRLRLLDYQIAFDDLQHLAITFSDVSYVADGISDKESVLNQASSMASSYDSTRRQAQNGQNSKDMLNNWVERGLDATNVKIMSNADNQNQTWDSHGMLFRAYDDVTDDYDDCQLKILNSTIAITDDNWKTIKTAVGGYYYFDPETGKLTYGFGVNGEVVIGKLVLGENLGIYNSSNTLKFDKNGLSITNGINSFVVNPNSNTLLKLSDNEDDLMWVDNKGNLHIKGTLDACDGTFSGSLEAATGTFRGELKAATGTFSGELQAATGSFSGDISGASGTFSGIVQASDFRDRNGNSMLNRQGQFTSDYLDVRGLNVNGNFIVDEYGNVTLTEGCISWSAYGVKNDIRNAYNAADDAYDAATDANTLAQNIIAGNAYGTFISGRMISSPTISGGQIYWGEDGTWGRLWRTWGSDGRNLTDIVEIQSNHGIVLSAQDGMRFEASSIWINLQPSNIHFKDGNSYTSLTAYINDLIAASK